MAPTENEPIIPPTLKMATAKLHTIVLAPELKGSPYRSKDTLWKNLRSFCKKRQVLGFEVAEEVFAK